MSTRPHTTFLLAIFTAIQLVLPPAWAGIGCATGLNGDDCCCAPEEPLETDSGCCAPEEPPVEEEPPCDCEAVPQPTPFAPTTGDTREAHGPVLVCNAIESPRPSLLRALVRDREWTEPPPRHGRPLHLLHQVFLS